MIDGYLLNLIEANCNAMDITFNKEGEPVFIENETSDSDTDENSHKNDAENEENSYRNQNGKTVKKLANGKSK